MSAFSHRTGRRAVLLGLGAALAGAGAALAEPVNPWAGRHLFADEMARLSLFGDVLRTNLAGYPVEIRTLDDHLRLRAQGADLFGITEADLTKTGIRLLTVLAEEFNRKDNLRAEVVAHHAGAGSYRDLIISKRRAEEVVATLRTRQVLPSRLKATGLGDNFPLIPSMSPDAIARNSRIEILFRPL